MPKGVYERKTKGASAVDEKPEDSPEGAVEPATQGQEPGSLEPSEQAPVEQPAAEAPAPSEDPGEIVISHGPLPAGAGAPNVQPNYPVSPQGEGGWLVITRCKVCSNQFAGTYRAKSQVPGRCKICGGPTEVYSEEPS